MYAMTLREYGRPLIWEQRTTPEPGPGQVRIKVEACGVCRTDLHVVDGELPRVPLPIIPGHEVVGIVEALGSGAQRIGVGARVGVSWLARTCGRCRYCRDGQENLCDTALFTGYTRHGGYATHVIADAEYVFPLRDEGEAESLAPLLCAGLIGWRCLRATGNGARIGLYGFGAAAHILAQVCRWEGRSIYAFTRPGDTAAQGLALSLGAAWAGGSDRRPAEPLDAAILFAPVGALVPAALQTVRKGGTVVCGGIHMSDIPAFPYRMLWEERRVVSVANLTRQDGKGFLDIAGPARIRTHTKRYALQEANQALSDLREGRLEGAAVLVP
ncbi:MULTISPECIES: zinc-dependent alcohol dehydrogenase family protein [unclassified Achromobacter]|uniref:zinc-dependent alcohol dehydrogenase family protein n=1 Tax=unclassified Achromobacter TaxID=2626865 RepID=UPI000B515366|nr:MULTISPECIES: zinc-dependent alcohol dehydrogenase family protein [unclassified Achromobacter]OWT74699.1 alcohol dehydrogenase [Achromobacter sp. HZ34]OWT79166.1 alcohol dehydrogenase [Achromobacter sp. HZ28]